MILIRKGREPESLRVYRQTPGADFDGMPKLEKDELRKALLDEQGHICAYCMRRIQLTDSTRIEHYEKRTEGNQLLYENLLLCCSGGEGKVCPEQYTCDKRKQDQVIHINPQKETDIRSISYTSNGKVVSSNDDFQQDIDKILNIRITHLMDR